LQDPEEVVVPCWEGEPALEARTSARVEEDSLVLTMASLEAQDAFSATMVSEGEQHREVMLLM
jgi:hypothetical protein